LGRFFTFILLAAFTGDGLALSISQSRLASAVDEHYCKVPREISVVQPTQRQVFLWFIARGVKAGDALEVDWLDPSGAISTTARYDDLPAASELCITTQLPVAGFGPASQPGEWNVRVTMGGRQLVSKRFQIAGDTYAGGPRVSSVAWARSGAAESDLTVRGDGFQAGSILHIAEYTRSGGWHYLASLQPRSLSPNELTAHYSGLPAAEYLAIVETPDLRMSRPMPFVISTSGYKLPFAVREPWVLTQGPYGTFSHWGNSLHAFDIAPVAGRCVVAMRAGIAYTHDNHLHQDHAHRSFGNYITIDHGDGEYSHYAHLATGLFVVANGQRVEQGQALATAGNSGYTLGEGGGYHVHVHVTRALPIASQSIPFQFEDLPGGVRAGLPRAIV
jgi:murein DD-endopeptidase MepM/ murein hydrolase activator NlpD